MSTNTLMFPGSGDVFVQFHDILGTPMFSVLEDLIYGKTLPGVFNFRHLGRVPIEEQIRWYMIRPRFNFLQLKNINVNHFTDEETDRILQQLLKNVSYETFPPVDLMTAFILHPIVERLHVYSKWNEPSINDVAQKLKHNVQQIDYRSGPIELVLEGAKDHASLITTSTDDAKYFLNSKYEHRYVSLIFPNMYDPIHNISDIYSKYGDRVSVIDIRKQVRAWKEKIV